MITTIGILTGAVLGTRYKVLCLVPVILAGTMALVVLDQLNAVPFSSTALAGLALAVGLQIGYLVGFAVRFLLGASGLTELGCLRDRPARSS